MRNLCVFSGFLNTYTYKENKHQISFILAVPVKQDKWGTIKVYAKDNHASHLKYRIEKLKHNKITIEAKIANLEDSYGNIRVVFLVTYVLGTEWYKRIKKSK